MEEAFTKSDVEILLSTMNRDSLDFLIPMFPFAHFSDFNILVINQTTENNLLSSEYPTVRVINAFEKGLSRSRNMALTNAKRKIVVLTDDDVCFAPDFDATIAEGFNNNADAAALRFMVSDYNGKVYKKYPKSVKNLSSIDILSSMSIELAFNRQKTAGFSYDEHFGLGGRFPLGEEHIFLADIKRNKLPTRFIPEVIVKHAPERNSNTIVFELRYETIGAYFTRMFSANFSFWLLIFMMFNVKGGRLPITQILCALSYAKNGRREYLATINKN